MTTRFVRAPNNHALIAAGIALCLLAAFGVWTATASNPYSIPVVPWVFMHGGRDAILGTALLFVALRNSQFSGAVAVIVATVLMYGIAMKAFASAAFGLAFHLGWGDAVDLAIVAAIVGPLLFPWSPKANSPVFFWVGLTFAALTLLFGSFALLARF
jgi:hypothetical protein